MLSDPESDLDYTAVEHRLCLRFKNRFSQVGVFNGRLGLRIVQLSKPKFEFSAKSGPYFIMVITPEQGVCISLLGTEKSCVFKHKLDDHIRPSFLAGQHWGTRVGVIGFLLGE